MSTEHLTSDELEDLREKLLDRRAEILGDIQDLNEELGDESDSAKTGSSNSDVPTHLADAASDEQSEQKTLRLTQHERDLVFEIDEALNRMDQGVYGQCQIDQEPISKQRLQAKPWARFCISHAENPSA